MVGLHALVPDILVQGVRRCPVLLSPRCSALCLTYRAMISLKERRQAYVLLQQKSVKQMACLTERRGMYVTPVEVHCVRADLSGGSREEAAA